MTEHDHHISEPDDRYSGDSVTREEKSLEWLTDPINPVIFDPQPGGADMPDPGSSASPDEPEQPAETAE